MKFLSTSAIALALLANSASAEGKLVIYHWFEYMPAELLEKFTAETGITVTMDTYDSNEAMLASLKAGGMGTYDVAVPGDYMVEIMAGEGLLDTIADGELANKGNISPEWADPSYSKKDKICIVLFVSLGFVFRFLVDFPTGPCASTNGDFTGAQKSNAGETRPRLLLLRNGDDGEKNERSI